MPARLECWLREGGELRFCVCEAEGCGGWLAGVTHGEPSIQHKRKKALNLKAGAAFLSLSLAPVNYVLDIRK
jgi:hypothetical protein